MLENHIIISIDLWILNQFKMSLQYLERPKSNRSGFSDGILFWNHNLMWVMSMNEAAVYLLTRVASWLAEMG